MCEGIEVVENTVINPVDDSGSIGDDPVDTTGDEPCPDGGDIYNSNCYETIDECTIRYKPTGVEYDVCPDGNGDGTTVLEPDEQINQLCGDYERISEIDADGCFTARCKDGGENDGKEYQVCESNLGGPDNVPCPDGGDINNSDCYEAITDCIIKYKPTGQYFDLCEDDPVEDPVEDPVIEDDPKVGDPCVTNGVQGTLQPDPDYLGFGGTAPIICVPNTTNPVEGCPAGKIDDGNGNCIDPPPEGCPAGSFDDGNGNCIEECDDPNRLQNPAGGCGECAGDLVEDSDGNCVTRCTDPDSTTYGEAGECGPCNAGFTKNTETGVCEEDGTSTVINPPVVEPVCSDPNSSTYGTDGECGPCNAGFERDPNSRQCESVEETTSLCGDPNATVNSETKRCGPCKEGFTKSIETGLCEADSTIGDDDDDDDDDDDGPDCTELNRDEDPNGGCLGCKAGYTENEDGDCVADTTDGPAGQTCNDVNSSTYGQNGACGDCNEGFTKDIDGNCTAVCDDPNALEGAFGACGDCISGYVKDDETGLCVASSGDGDGTDDGTGEGETCGDANATTNDDGSCGPCKEGFVKNQTTGLCVGACDDPNNQDPNGGCKGDTGDGTGDGTCGDPNSTTYEQEGECGPCKSGYVKDADGNCQGTGECGDPNSTTYGQQGACGDCNEGYEKDANGICQEGDGDGTGTCEDVNATVNDDGSCGPCEEGFVRTGLGLGGGFTGNCVGECNDPNAVQLDEGGCGDCKAGFTFDFTLERCVGDGNGNGNGDDDDDDDDDDDGTATQVSGASRTNTSTAPENVTNIESYEYSGPLDELMRELGVAGGQAPTVQSVGASQQEAELDSYIDDLLYGNGSDTSYDYDTDSDVDDFLNSMGIQI